MRCLLINEVESANIGDQAIAEALSSAVLSLGNTVIQADYSSGRRITASEIGSRRAARRGRRLGFVVPKPIQNLRWFLRSFSVIRQTSRQDCDLALIGGGQLILSNGHFILALATWAFFLRRSRVPYSLVGCGVGSTFKGWEKCLLRWVARHAQGGIHLRDDASRNRLLEITGVPSGFVPDLAFMLPYAGHLDSGNGDSHRKVALSVTDYDVYRRYCPELAKTPATEAGYLEDWLRVAERFVASGAILTLVATTPGDAIQTEKFRGALGQRSMASTDVLVPKSWREYCDIVKDCSLVVSGRMHGLILARIAGVPVQPYVVSKKLEAFVHECQDASPEHLGRQAKETVARVIGEMRSR